MMNRIIFTRLKHGLYMLLPVVLTGGLFFTGACSSQDTVTTDDRTTVECSIKIPDAESQDGTGKYALVLGNEYTIVMEVHTPATLTNLDISVPDQMDITHGICTLTETGSDHTLEMTIKPVQTGNAYIIGYVLNPEISDSYACTSDIRVFIGRTSMEAEEMLTNSLAGIADDRTGLTETGRPYTTKDWPENLSSHVWDMYQAYAKDRLEAYFRAHPVYFDGTNTELSIDLASNEYKDPVIAKLKKTGCTIKDVPEKYSMLTAYVPIKIIPELSETAGIINISIPEKEEEDAK